ncbi:MAG: hypothetical protein HY904_11635 [Deltaproteobacteria bacterium]|nr:hypothetical protein [Deltaproteobacteria bacterium]
MHRGSLRTLCFLPVLALTCGAAGDVTTAPQVEALVRDFAVVKTAELDVDGDGQPESAVIFRDADNGGGLLALRWVKGNWRQVACVYLEGHLPVDASVTARELAFTFEGNDKPLVLDLGKDVGLVDREGDPFAGITVTASSSLKGEFAPRAAFDGDVTTSWAEGKDGTGIGESISFEFKKPVHLGLVGVFTGRGTSAKDFKDNNRIRKAILETFTPSNVGDSSANLDFADLGIASGGHVAEVQLANKPELKFFRLTEEDVVKFTLRVDSVYLGDKKDDTHVAEVMFCPHIPEAQVKALAKKKRAAAPVKAP